MFFWGKKEPLLFSKGQRINTSDGEGFIKFVSEQNKDDKNNPDYIIYVVKLDKPKKTTIGNLVGSNYHLIRYSYDTDIVEIKPLLGGKSKTRRRVRQKKCKTIRRKNKLRY
jgi:hypothetical protein